MYYAILNITAIAICCVLQDSRLDPTKLFCAPLSKNYDSMSYIILNKIRTKDSVG